jgi:hypothetical protein
MTNSYLSHYDKTILLERLRLCNSELFYDKLSHNKVLSYINNKTDAYILIPTGNKALVWYTYYKKDNVCILITFNKYNKFQDMNIYHSCFSNELIVNDSIFLGYQCENTEKCETLYGKYRQIFFACTDIIRYKGKNLDNTNYADKLRLYNTIFTYDIRQISYSKYTLIFGLAIINKTYDELLANISKASYNVAFIECMQFDKTRSLGIFNISLLHRNLNLEKTKPINSVIFKVKASIYADIYNLYFYDNGSSDNFHNIALINNYKKSVFMNGLFRNIKENRNLDLLEESDDEEEFENISEDKYVDTNKTLMMTCVYNKRFKKWEPIEVINTNKIINKGELYNLKI